MKHLALGQIAKKGQSRLSSLGESVALTLGRRDITRLLWEDKTTERIAASVAGGPRADISMTEKVR